MSSMSSATCCRSAAAAQNSIFSWPKKCSRSPVVLPQLRDEQLVSFRHVEVGGDRNLAQIAHGRVERARHRLAVVYVERAAVVKDDPEVVVAAEGVIPRQPVAQHRRVLEHRHDGSNHGLVGAEHALGVDHALRPAGRSRRVENLGDGVRRDGRVRVVYGAGRRRRQQLGEARRGDRFRPACPSRFPCRRRDG